MMHLAENCSAHFVWISHECTIAVGVWSSLCVCVLTNIPLTVSNFV